MEYACTAERFAQDVASHQMTVIRADGVHRHIRFKKPGDSCHWFDIVTWPWKLCITGDCGTYVFSRLEDMFRFFRGKPGSINPGYWAEKVEAQDRHGGIYEYSEEAFIQRVVEAYRDYWRDTGRFRDQLEGFRELRLDVLSAETEEEAHHAMSEFQWKGFEFHDTWEWDLKRYTYSFIWNLRAIVWAIEQWDASQAVAA